MHTNRNSIKNLKLPSQDTVLDTLELIELGKQAKIVFHDLSNHLTSLTLSIGNQERAQTQLSYVTNLLRSHLDGAPDSFFNPHTEVQEIITVFSEKIRTGNILIQCKYDANDTDMCLFGSVRAFAHIITNLLSNAIESFDEIETSKTKEIKIRIHSTSDQCVLLFADTGCGIPASTIPHIFKPKFTTKAGGHGIGLWATKEYVEQKFRGSISVRSSAKGSAFTVQIPITQTAQTRDNSHTQTKNRKQILFPVFQKTHAATEIY